MPKYSFPTQIVLQERSRDNRALLSQMRFKFTSEFKFWNSMSSRRKFVTSTIPRSHWKRKATKQVPPAIAV